MLGSADKLKTARNIAVSGAVSGNANFDGSGNINIVTTQANIAIITGTLAEDPSAYMTTVDLPNGYNSTNSVVISVMTQSPSDTYNRWGTGSIFNSSSYLTGSVPVGVKIDDTTMTIRMRNIQIQNGSEQTVFASNGAAFKFKVVLMKIA